MKKYVYWVNASCFYLDNQGQNIHVTMSLKYTSDHKFNSKSIDECTERFRSEIKNNHKVYSGVDVVIKFFGKLYD